MFSCRRFALCCALLLPLSPQAAELVILIDNATEMPMARLEKFRVVDGMEKDIGEALAKAMGRQPRFLALPRKRVVPALRSGSAGILCGFFPEWVDGTVDWSQPFLPLVEVVITSRAAERPRTLEDLRGQPIGTVFGYFYPELDRELGTGFVRADGPNTVLALRKLAAGRLRNVVTMKSFAEYRQKLGDPLLALHPPQVVKAYMTRCAISPKGRVSAAEVDHTLSQLIQDGTIAKISARYQ